jgi:hypothetical protein
MAEKEKLGRELARFKPSPIESLAYPPRSPVDGNTNNSAMIKTDKTPKFLRVILDLSTYTKPRNIPFIRIEMKGVAEKEIAVAQQVPGSSDLYMAVIVWPPDISVGYLVLGMLNNWQTLEVDCLDDKRYSVAIDEDVLIYIPWGKELEMSWTGEPRLNHVALFVNVSEDNQYVGILGSCRELGYWKTELLSDDISGMGVKKGLSLFSVPLSRHPEEREVEFRHVKVDGEELALDEYVKKTKFPASACQADIVIWSRWGNTDSVASYISDVTDLSRPRSSQSLRAQTVLPSTLPSREPIREPQQQKMPQPMQQPTQETSLDPYLHPLQESPRKTLTPTLTFIQ